MQLVWLITGTSSGFGRDLTLEALKRGDKVIATARARSLSKLSDLKKAGADVLELDVTDPLDKLHEVAKKAVKIHGRVDVVVNNAGFIQNGFLEEVTPEETFSQFNTNVFGALNVSRAFLPYMRKRRTGTVVFLGSISGWIVGPNAGLYQGSKHAVRGLSESLRVEIEPLGLRSICIEPGYFRTKFLQPGNRTATEGRGFDDYKEQRLASMAVADAMNGHQIGDPQRAVEVMIDIVKSEGQAAGRKPPPFVGLGSDAYTMIRDACNGALQTLEDWKDVITSTDLKEGK
ncbi:hypothetical protein EUX98_g1704 [Antrodiella citrinella]|uniref:NAD(P)-binding protein n=1 Tax=Antrodiella citrinella TaxID=2447956 RepID=A0A4S4N383_9APHY|nr:hypothetical protein EUX98_g1704 [Antrodiella citrinella]